MKRDPVAIDRRRAVRMQTIDAMPPPMRELVNAYGYFVVNQFIDCGIKDARRIRHLVEVVLDEFSPTRGTKSSQGARAAPGLRHSLD